MTATALDQFESKLLFGDLLFMDLVNRETQTKNNAAREENRRLKTELMARGIDPISVLQQ